MLPLEGLTVIAVEQAVAAPFCSSRLADAGAQVIKIERPEGDFARGYDAAAKGQSSYFVWLNRGKDSAVIDLATKEGRASLEELIAGADVLLQNLKPGSMDKLGFSLERLRKDYPKLICCTISGYGDDGPYAHRKAYDLLIQAESGLASITVRPAGDRGEPALGLDQEIVGLAMRIGAVVAIAGNGAADQLWIIPAQALQTKAELVHRAGFQVLQQHVGAGDQLFEAGAPFLGGEVDDSGILAAVEPDEIAALALRGRIIAAGKVALGALDLDDLGAGVGQPRTCLLYTSDAADE